MDLLEKATELGVDKWTIADFVLGVESLRQQLADKHQLFMCASANYDRLAEQLAECEWEREKQIKECNEFWGKKSDADYGEIQRLAAERDELVAALKQFAECDLNDDNCASLEVATRRIRSLAQAALAKLGAEKGEQT